MNTDQIMQLTYLMLLAAAIGGSAIVAGRDNMGKMAQQAAIWALIFVGVIGAYGLWDDLQNDVAPRQAMIDDNTVAIPLGNDGHYALTVDINGTPIDFLVDTGASLVVLSRDDARALGIDPSQLRYSGFANTANGTVRTAPVTLDQMTLGPIVDRNVRAVVNDGDLNVSLLGMSYLDLFNRIEITNGRMLLIR